LLLNEHGSLGSHLYRGPDDIRHRHTPWPSAVAKTEGFSLLPVVRMPVASCARRLLRACGNRYANPSPTSWRQFNQTPANRVFKPSALRKGLGCGEPGFPLFAQSARCWHARATGNEATLANHPTHWGHPSRELSPPARRMSVTPVLYLRVGGLRHGRARRSRATLQGRFRLDRGVRQRESFWLCLYRGPFNRACRVAGGLSRYWPRR